MNRELRMDVLEQAVWHEVAHVLQDPARLEDEYRRRLLPGTAMDQLEQVETHVSKLRRSLARLIDSYAEGLIDKAEFAPRVQRVRERLRQSVAEAKQVREQVEVEADLRLIVGQLERFATQVQVGLEHADWHMRRQIIRTLVKRVELDTEQIRVVFRVSPHPSNSSASPFDSAPHDLQHCG
jgi:site-specific DNA recombinase